MTVRDYRNDSIPLNAKSVYGYIITTSGPASDPQVTAVAGTAAERFGPTIDVGINNNARNGVIAQYGADDGSIVGTGVGFEIQWSQDGTTWYPAPSSTQGEARLSLITTTGQDRGMVTRGQVLTRYLRWHITGAAALAAGKVFLWYGRI